MRKKEEEGRDSRSLMMSRADFIERTKELARENRRDISGVSDLPNSATLYVDGC